MLIITLFKGVPARTTRVVTIGGVLKREEMDIVMNPHDFKALEAADYIKRSVGGKLIALTMGPDVKLSPIVNSLFDAPIEGIDEGYVLSDRRMAGADTWATAYTVAKGIRKVVDVHVRPVETLISMVEGGAGTDELIGYCRELYNSNMLPNAIYSELPTIRNSTVTAFAKGELTREETLRRLRSSLEELRRFVVVAGIKTTDGETGSTGPQVAEALSEMNGGTIPSLTYVRDFDIHPEDGTIIVERKLGDLFQRLRSRLPCVLTISPEYRSRVPSVRSRKAALLRNYRCKVRRATIWNAGDIDADPSKIGLAGSPTIVGPGVDVGAPQVRKLVGVTKVCLRRVERFSLDGKTYGPFERGTKVDDLPHEVIEYLEERGDVGTFTLEMLIEEVFGVKRVVVERSG
ncbi:MAG: hypothetical protein NZ920_01405 [Aigarchaeota archaeon]|nr:hypothetical protein [Aigarchaeota archaeon]MDW8093098.1 hypothetical protein [Nitrososphaerota archaeon]